LSCTLYVNELNLAAVIRIRPGRSWRTNPAYTSALSAVDAARARGFDGGEILDVLGIEVDGVDIAAGIGEGRLLLSVDELLRALLRIGEGASAAQATVGPGPTELVLEARGEELLLTLVSLAPVARLVASGLLVDGRKMRKAVLQAARGLLLDLLSFSAELSSAEVTQRLSASVADLARQDRVAAPPWPRHQAAAKTLACKVPPGSEILSLRLSPEAMARLLGAGRVPHARLAAHLGQGTVALQRKSGPGLAAEGSVFLLLRNLLEEAERLIEFQENGDAEYTLRFGTHELRWDLRAGEARAAGFRTPARLPPMRFAQLVAKAARSYGQLSLRSTPLDELARDLLERGSRLLRHCRDLQSGDLTRARTVAAVPSTPPEAGALAPRMRRLIYREAVRVELGDAMRVLPSQTALVVERRSTLEARDAASGEAIWSMPALPGAAVRGGDLFFSEPGDALVCADAVSGEVRFRRRLRGAAHPGRIWATAKGVLRSLPGEGIAFVDDRGTLRFRGKLPGGEPLELVEVDNVFVAVTSGFCIGLDQGGDLLWKRRGAARELVACGPHALALEERLLSCFSARTGKTLARAEVPDGSRALCAEGDRALLLGGGALLAFALDGLSPLPPLPLPWAAHIALARDPDGVLVSGEGGAAARIDGRRWTVEPDGSPAAPPQARRGVVLLRRANNQLIELESGLTLASLPPGDAVLRDDLSCAILVGGALRLFRLATHLSVL
jgi:hypothetical protein